MANASSVADGYANGVQMASKFASQIGYIEGRVHAELEACASSSVSATERRLEQLRKLEAMCDTIEISAKDDHFRDNMDKVVKLAKQCNIVCPNFGPATQPETDKPTAGCSSGLDF